MSDQAGDAKTTDRPLTLYDVVGGDRFFFDLVDRFYDGVEEDPVLMPLYPADLTYPRRKTALFLIQYWGGPGTYSEERGHPRLRMRHLPFAIGQVERDAWLLHMTAAVEATLSDAPEGALIRDEAHGDDATTAVREAFTQYFDRASTAMINS